MAIRSFIGFLNADLFGPGDPVVGDTFTVDPADQMEILISDGINDLVVEGDTRGGNSNSERSQDSEGDQFLFARDSSGNILSDGEEFYLESIFTFTIDGQSFTGYHFEAEGSGTNFTILPPNLPAGEATITSVNLSPSPDSVPYDALTSGDETIDDTLYTNLNLAGNDVIIAGEGSDVINGGAGNDVIYGDATPTGVNYSFIPDPSGDGSVIDDNDDLSGGVTLTGGNVQVDFAFVDNTLSSGSEFRFNNTDTQNTSGLNDDVGATNNAILLTGPGGIGDTSTVEVTFSATDPSVTGEVENVTFRINDIDDASWQDTVTIRAFNAAGEEVEVTLTGGANLLLSDSDGDGINDTATAIDGSGNVTPASASGSLLVEIDGPVSTIIIEYGNLGTGGQRVDLTEIYFQAIPTDDSTGFDDEIDGGAGDDIIYGNQGDDTFFISSGTDSISGGTGSDTFTAQGGTSLTGETISVIIDADGNGTITKTNDGTTDTVTSVETFIADESPSNAGPDTITLTADGLTAADIAGLSDAAVGTYTSTNGLTTFTFGGAGEPTLSEILSGTLVLNDGTSVSGTGSFAITSGDESGQIGDIAFENFENINFTIVCFAAGTMIRTAHGLAAVETLEPGDVVLTADNGPQPIRWAGSTQVDAAMLAHKPRLQPIRIKAGALAPDVPARDLVVSPQHRIMVRSSIAMRMFDVSEVFVAAKDLVGLSGVEVATDLTSVTYVHIMCDNHEIIEAEGALAETLYTGTEAMKAMTDDARREINDMFGNVAYLNRPLARVTPRGNRAKRLIERHMRNDKALYQSLI